MCFSGVSCSYFFFFNDTATTEIYTLSLHDALPISLWPELKQRLGNVATDVPTTADVGRPTRDVVEEILALTRQLNRGLSEDRKSTRLNSSHANISYAVFCLKKKKTKPPRPTSNAVA